MGVEVVNVQNCKELPVMESLMEEDLGASLPMNRDRIPVVGSPLAVRRYASAAMTSGVSRSDGTSVGP